MEARDKGYHKFLFLSTFTRGLVEVFSLVLLAKKGFSREEIFFFLLLMYSIGILVNLVSLKIKIKVVLVVSSLLYGIGFWYLSVMPVSLWALVLLALILASSNYSYHVIRHLLALLLLDRKKNPVRGIVLVNYLGIILSSLVGMFLIEQLPLFLVSGIILLLSFFSLLPILKMKFAIETPKLIAFSQIKIERTKIIFSILEQFKVLFLELQPLFLYWYVQNSVYYVGLFQVVVNVASLVFVYFLAKKLSKRYFRYVTLGLGAVFLLKLNIKSGSILLLLAFFEGILVKIYENVSLENLYLVGNFPIVSYLLYEEIIFFGSKSIFMLIVLLFKIPFTLVLYICIVGLIASGFFIQDNER